MRASGVLKFGLTYAGQFYYTVAAILLIFNIFTSEIQNNIFLIWKGVLGLC